jgi:AbrB family looped-hinge helix DNA binding protein
MVGATPRRPTFRVGDQYRIHDFKERGTDARLDIIVPFWKSARWCVLRAFRQSPHAQSHAILPGVGSSEAAIVRTIARIDAQGRLTIPAEARLASGIGPGSTVTLEAVGGEIRVRSLAAPIARVQEKYKRLARGRNIVDEFLAERRKND